MRGHRQQLPGVVSKKAFAEHETKRLRARAADLKHAIKRLGAARRRLLRFARTACSARKGKLQHVPRGSLGRRVRSADVATSCAADRAKALSQYGAHLSKLIDELAYTRSMMDLRPRKSRTTASERRQEHLDEQTYNIPPELLPLWNKIGKSARFKPTARADRYERFMEYVEENPDELIHAAQSDADQFLREMIKEYESQGAESSAPF